LAELDQKNLKVGIHSFPACRSAFERVSAEIGWQTLVVSLGKALNGIASTFEW